MRDNDLGVRSKDEFTAYVRHLSRSIANAPDSWENNTLPAFLEALAAWVDDMDGFYANRGEPSPAVEWPHVARMLAAARSYE